VERFGLDTGPNVILVGALVYMGFLNLWKDARMVLTDSGGRQEEKTAPGVSCIAFREHSERPITIYEGTNTLAGTSADGILAAARSTMEGRGKSGRRPALRDGSAAMRIAKVLGDALAAHEPPR